MSTSRTKYKKGRQGAARRKGSATPQKSVFQRLKEIELVSKKQVSRRDLISFTRELAVLIEAGIGVGHALQLLGTQRAGTAFEPVINALASDLSSGSTIADAMVRHPEVFPRIYVRTIASADRGAPLASTLRQAADFMDSAQSAMAQAKRAMIYPAIIVLVGVGVVIMLLTVSLPQMIGLFQNLGTELPLPTRILIALSDFIRAYYIYILIVSTIGGFALSRFMKTPRGVLLMHMAMLRIPIMKEVVISSDLGRAAGALAALGEAGLPIPEAMDVARETVGNEVVRRALADARAGLMSGEGLAVPLAATGVFPATFIQTLRVAEDSGTLDANLRRMADFYQKDATEKVKSLVGVIEPLATVVVALAVGFIALSVILPMYTVLGSIE